MENASIHCFKRGVKEDKFVNTINYVVCYLSRKTGIPVDRLPLKEKKREKKYRIFNLKKN
jgi:hypothetical protein